MELSRLLYVATSEHAVRDEELLCDSKLVELFLISVREITLAFS